MQEDKKVFIKKARAAELLGVSRQRIDQYLNHKEYSKLFEQNEAGELELKSVQAFRNRDIKLGRPKLSEEAKLIRKKLQEMS